MKLSNILNFTCQNLSCKNPIASHERACSICQKDAGFPNVRACQKNEEVEALFQRYKLAKREARRRGCIEPLRKFEQILEKKSKAIICKSISLIQSIMSSDNNLYVSFYKSVFSGARIPEDNEWDLARQSADSLIFPYYYEEIVFAALSLNNEGVKGYGSCCVVLKNAMIEDRASVFDVNTIVFVKTHNLSAGNPVPPGYRADWARRAKLAVAKLGGAITLATTETLFSKLLIPETGDRDGDFIEVHIYGSIHRKAVEGTKVVSAKKLRRPDKVLLASLKRKAIEVGARFEASE